MCCCRAECFHDASVQARRQSHSMRPRWRRRAAPSPASARPWRSRQQPRWVPAVYTPELVSLLGVLQQPHQCNARRPLLSPVAACWLRMPVLAPHICRRPAAGCADASQLDRPGSAGATPPPPPLAAQPPGLQHQPSRLQVCRWPSDPPFPAVPCDMYARRRHCLAIHGLPHMSAT